MRIRIPHEFTPRDYQERVMRFFDGGGDRAFNVWHRRAGKDLFYAHQTCKAMTRRVGTYWHLFPTYKQGRKALWDGFRSDGKRVIDNVFPPQIVYKRNEQEMKVQIVGPDGKPGSIWQIVGSDNYDSFVGANPVGVVFSEWALSRPSSWTYVRPILAENKGWAAFNTTPRGKNHAYKDYLQALDNPRWYCDKLSIYDTKALDPSVLDEERRSGMPENMIEQEYLVNFDAAQSGAVYGDLIEKMKPEQFQTFDYAKEHLFTAWDLGISDATAIWFFRVAGDSIEVVDYYEAHGQPLSHYFDEIERRGYSFSKHWLPHDARQRTLQTGVSILDQFISRYGRGRVAIGPSMSFMDGVQAGRWLLQKPVRFHPNAEKGLEALRAYHYEWDEDTKSFSAQPAHDWSSHGADGWRYLSLVVRVSRLIRGDDKPPEPKNKRVADLVKPVTYTLDRLFADRERDLRKSRRRI